MMAHSQGSQASGRDVEQQRPAGVADIRGVDPAAGQPPEQPRIDRPEGELAGLRTRPQARRRIQDVGDLGPREVGIERQARERRTRGLVTRGAQRVAAARP